MNKKRIEERPDGASYESERSSEAFERATKESASIMDGMKRREDRESKAWLQGTERICQLMVQAQDGTGHARENLCGIRYGASEETGEHGKSPVAA